MTSAEQSKPAANLTVEHAGQRIGTNFTAWIAALRRPPRSRLQSPWSAQAWAFWLCGVIALIVVAMLFLDAPAITLQRQLPRFVVAAFAAVTDLGKSGWFLWPCGVTLIVLAAITSPHLGKVSYGILGALAARVGFVFLAIGIPGLFVTIVKRLIGRVRPSDLGPFAYEPFSWKAAYASLPSGHATTAFAAAIAIGSLFPRTRPVMWLFAGTIALSRVAVSAHYPSDVIAGAAIGAATALLVRRWFALRRLAFIVKQDGRITPRLGPSLRRIKKVAAQIWAH
jgi:undecaprenyl-diphosphatase